jgi:hypothetical protein
MQPNERCSSIEYDQGPDAATRTGPFFMPKHPLRFSLGWFTRKYWGASCLNTKAAAIVANYALHLLVPQQPTNYLFANVDVLSAASTAQGR